MNEPHNAEPSQETVNLEVDLARAGISSHCHWTIGRKAAFLGILQDYPAAAAGLLFRFNISAEELASWRSAHARHGVGGLKVTRRLAA